MPGTLLRDDWQSVVEDELKKHVQGIVQFGQHAVQQVQEIPRPQLPTVDPNQVMQELQQHVQQISQSPPAQQAIQFGQQAQQQVQQAAEPVVQFGRQQVQQQLQDYAQQLAGASQPSAAVAPPPVQPGTPAPVVGGGTFQDYARQQAQRYGLDPEIFARQIQQESGFNPQARSPAGATGIAQFMPQCVVLDAEILTTDGWKTYDEVRVGESIVSYNAATDQLEPDCVEALYVGTAPSVVRMWNKRFDFTSTPDHRWYVRRGLNPQTKLRLRRGGRTSKPAGETIVKRTNELQVAIRHNLIRVAPFAFRTEPLHSDELIALCGWVFSDGSIGKRGRQVDLYQSERANPTKCAEIERLVGAVGGGASRLATSDGLRRWCLTGETAAQISDLLGPDKRMTVAFLQRLTCTQAELLYRACLDGDGYTIAGRYDCFIQADLGRAEDFQLLCLFLGRIANIQTYARKTPTQAFPGGRSYAVKPKLHVNVRVAQTTQTDKRRMQYEAIDVPTSVWCPTTRNRTWVARRAGMVTITGNTAQGMGVDPSDPYQSLEGAARLMGGYVRQYNGDYSRALAAYNAGPGNVEKYGGVPPFEETQRYVSTILGTRDTGPYRPGTQESLERVGQGIAPRDISQFGDAQLTNSEAYSACGPAAAVRFAERFGRNPTLREAVDLAKQVGWTEQQGMAGITSQQQLMERLGVPTRIMAPDQWAAVAREAQSGNPVTISTEGHYFFADGYDPQSGAFHVGRSGTDLRGGKEWMTRGDMESRMGAVQGVLLADNPTVPTKSAAGTATGAPVFNVAGDQARPAARPVLYAGANQPAGPQEDQRPPLQIITDELRQAAGGMVAAPGGGLPASAQPTPSDVLTRPKLWPEPPAGVPMGPAQRPPPSPTVGEAIGGAFSDLGTAAQQVTRRATEQAETQGRQVEDTLRALDQARSTILQSNRDTLPDAVSRAGEILGNTDLGRAVAENQANPPLYGVREAIANAPVLGGVLGAIRNPNIIPNQELLGQNPTETERARAQLRDWFRAEPTDQEVADQLRSKYQVFGATEPLGVLGGAARAARGLAADAGRLGRVEAALPEPRPGLPAGAAEPTSGFRAPEPRLAGAVAEARPYAPELATGGAGAGLPPRPPEPPFGGRGAEPGPPGGSSPELDRLNAMFGGKKSAEPSSLADRLAGVRDNLTRAFTDRQVDINRAQERYAANLGRPLRGDEMAAELQRLASDPVAQVKVDEGLKPAIQSVGADYPALRNEVTLRSNVEIADALAARTGKPEVGTERLFSGGLNREQSVKALQDLEAQLGPERYARVQAAADQVTAFNQMLRQRLVDGGVLDANTAAQLEVQYPNWAKTRILDYMADPAGGQASGTKLGLNDRGLREYTLAGTARAREDPVASTVAYAHQVERMAMKNEAFNAFLKIDQAGSKPMLRQVPQSYSPTKNEVTMIGFVNGQKQKYVTDNKALGAAINGAGVLATPEWTSAWQKIFRSLATSRNPVFLAGNAALDIPTYVLRSSVRQGGPQALPRILYELARGYADAFQGLLQGEYRGTGTAQFLKGGGGQSGYFTGGEGRTKQAVAEMQRRHVFQIDNVSDLGRLTKDLLTLHPVEALGERIELGPRVAAMRLAERRGANATQAVIDGRTVTVDFSQGGTVTKYLNNFIPFFNVGFQGPAQIARAFRENPGAFVATVGSLIGTPSVAAEVWNRSDPQRAKDYADVPQYVKDQGVVIMLPGEAPADAQGNRKPLYAVVKLREWAPFAAVAREATARVMGDDTRSWQDMASSIGAGLSPTQATSAAQAGTEPLSGIPILPAAAQLEFNKDFFRGRTIVSQRADQNASALAQTLAPALQQIMDKAGANVEIRPSAIDFLIRNQGAGVGGAVLGASDLAAQRPSDIAGPTGLPVVGGLAGRFVGSQTGDEFQRAREQTLTPDARQILRSNGITLTPGPVSSSVNQIPLKIEEETRYQQLTNQYIDEAIQRTAASSDFASKTQVGKQSMIDQAMQGARGRAGNEVLNTIPAAEKQRRLKTKSTAA